MDLSSFQVALSRAVNRAAEGAASRLPLCSSIRTKPGTEAPKVRFRILHVASDQIKGFGNCKQTVQVTLGPDSAFQSSIGRLTHLVPSNRVARAINPSKRRAKRSGNTKGGNKRSSEPPKIVELIHKAEERRRQPGAGEVAAQAEIARREGITRGRMTQQEWGLFPFPMSRFSQVLRRQRAFQRYAPASFSR